jgi:hypothetical protein
VDNHSKEKDMKTKITISDIKAVLHVAFVASLVCLLCAACKEAVDDEPDVDPQGIVPIPAPSARRIEFYGHSYVEFSNPHVPQALSVVHDPMCDCQPSDPEVGTQ